MFLLLDLPEQLVELLDQPVNVSPSHRPPLPPLYNVVAQQRQEKAEYPATDEEMYGHILCSSLALQPQLEENLR
jgi:hypothetical protein